MTTPRAYYGRQEVLEGAASETYQNELATNYALSHDLSPSFAAVKIPNTLVTLPPVHGAVTPGVTTVLLRGVTPLRQSSLPGIYLLMSSFCVSCRDAENISQVAMNIEAITGPITKPLRPKIAMPPSVESSTT
jgi:hypothetical protein